MTSLDDLPSVEFGLLGIDLKTGCFIVACISICHPLAFGCSFFLPMSCILVTCWIMVIFYFVFSIVLYYSIVKDDAFLCQIWVWYALIFIVVMIILLTMLAVIFTSNNQKAGLLFVMCGIMWYMLSIYFVLVVNTYRKKLVDTTLIALKMMDKRSVDVL